jgi:pimeloyl-ACP methyl ester carboxylesterase
MPYVLVRGINLYYEFVGEEGPWVTLAPGAWVSSQLVKPLAASLAAAGYRVILHDGRNTGMSDQSLVSNENITKVWAEERWGLLRELDIAPVYAGGFSAGAMTSLLLALHHPEAVSGLLLWLVARRWRLV